MPPFWWLLYTFLKAELRQSYPNPHTPFPFLETPPSSPSPNHKRQRSASPGRGLAPPQTSQCRRERRRAQTRAWAGKQRSLVLPLSGQSEQSPGPRREDPGAETPEVLFPFFCHVPSIDVSPLPRFRLDTCIFQPH